MDGILEFYVARSNTDIDGIKDSYCYIVSKKGIIMKRKNTFFTQYKKLDEISCLEEVKEKVEYNFPKIDEKILNEIADFFRDVMAKYSNSEAMVLLYYNNTDKKYIPIIPEQTVSRGKVDYDIPNKSPDNCILIGTIHSHNTMSAFHSGVDDKDEIKFDGLHITLGKLDEDPYMASYRLMIGGDEIKLNKEDCINFKVKELIYNKEWLDKVKEKKVEIVSSYPVGRFGVGFNSYSNYTDYFNQIEKEVNEEFKNSNSGNNITYRENCEIKKTDTDITISSPNKKIHMTTPIKHKSKNELKKWINKTIEYLKEYQDKEDIKDTKTTQMDLIDKMVEPVNSDVSSPDRYEFCE